MTDHLVEAAEKSADLAARLGNMLVDNSLDLARTAIDVTGQTSEQFRKTAVELIDRTALRHKDFTQLFSETVSASLKAISPSRSRENT